MREILFRGKRVDNGEWAYGFHAYSEWENRHFIIEDEGDDISRFTDYEIDSKTVGQFTGLTDKNGKKIFEGDICRDSLGWTFEVVWDSDNGRFLGRHSKPRGDAYICYVGREPAVEVIGNIYDNPELLEGSK